jgi:hypothetical protein
VTCDVLAVAGRDHSDSVVDRVKFGFLTSPPYTGVGSVVANREPYALGPVAPFEIVGTFWVLLFLAVNQHHVRLYAAIG